jgi:hypothetical protein
VSERDDQDSASLPVRFNPAPNHQLFQLGKWTWHPFAKVRRSHELQKYRKCHPMHACGCPRSRSRAVGNTSNAGATNPFNGTRHPSTLPAIWLAPGTRTRCPTAQPSTRSGRAPPVWPSLVLAHKCLRTDRRGIGHAVRAWQRIGERNRGLHLPGLGWDVCRPSLPRFLDRSRHHQWREPALRQQRQWRRGSGLGAGQTRVAAGYTSIAVVQRPAAVSGVPRRRSSPALI